MTNNIIIVIHLMAAAIAIGGMVFAVVLLLPSMEKLPEHKGPEEHSISYKSLEILAPTVFACLLVLIGTGIYFLLENYTAQVELKPGYYDLFGVKLICVVCAFIRPSTCAPGSPILTCHPKIGNWFLKRSGK